MDTPATQQLFDLALEHHRCGRQREAMEVYREILRRDANHADALHLLGVVTHQFGRDSDTGLELVRRATAISPSAPEYHCNLGLIFSDLRRWQEAAVAFGRALALRPSYAVVHNHLGVALREMGRLEESVASYRRAVACKADFFVAWSNLGNVLRELNRMEESEAACRRAIAINPNFAPAHNNLGNALNKQDRLDEAIAEYRRSLTLEPRSPETLSNLANACKDLGRLDEAIATYRDALVLNPGLSGCHSNLIYDLHYRAEFDPHEVLNESRAWATQHADPLSANIRPHANNRDPERRLVIGYVSPDFRQHAVSSFFLPLLKNHDRRQFEVICYSNVRAPDHVTQSIRQLADKWRDIVGVPDDRAAELIRADGVDILVDLAGHTAQSRLLLFARKPAPIQITWLGYPGTTGLSAIDYKLTDVLADPPGLTESHYSENLLRLPRTNWCFTPIVEAPPVGPFPALSKSNETKVPPVPSPAESRGRDEGPKAAQFSAPGHVAPDFDERRRTVVPETRSGPAVRPGRHGPAPNAISVEICFGSFSNFAKITSAMLNTWARLLLEVPHSRLMIKAKAMAVESSRQQVVRHFSDLGISPQRLDLRGRLLNPAEHLAMYNQIDIALDTFPYHGTTTTCEALWMGVPVVTLAGNAHLSRVGVSLLTNVGLKELIAETPEQYIEIAAGLAADLPRLADLRAGLRQRMLASRLTDGASFARDVEAQFRSAWKRWCAGADSVGVREGANVGWALPAIESSGGQCPPYTEHRPAGASAGSASRTVISTLREPVRNPNPARATQADLDHYRQILAQNPDDAEAHFNLGSALHFLGQADEAIACFRRTLELLPDKPEAIANLASAMQARGEIEPAISLFRRALELKPSFAEAHYNLGLALLLTGQFHEGWKEYEHRLALPGTLTTPLPFRVPRWDGRDLNGRTILIHAEQGFGDTIQFVRYVPEVVRRGGRVLLVVRRELERLLQGQNTQGAEVISRLILGSRPIDMHLPLMSLPLVLGIDAPLTTSQPYLRPPSHLNDLARVVQVQIVPPVPSPAESVAARPPVRAPAALLIPQGDLKRPEVTSYKSAPKVGLVWAGNPEHKGDRLRSLPLAALAPLARADATFFSLQLGPAAEQVRTAPMPLVDLTARFTDFAETADLIAQLDLVIAVDTAIAHLAAAMGKETWILLPFAPDWRWRVDRSDGDWYPSVRLFRQAKPGEWETPVALVVEELTRRSGKLSE